MSRVAVVTATVLLLLLAAAPPAGATVPYAVPSPVATGPGTQSSPQVAAYWDTIWEDDAAGQWDVVRLFGPTLTVLPAGTSAQRHPVGSGYKVVYEDDRASNWDIFVFDTLDPEPATREKQLTTDLGDQLDPDIYSSWVVFEDKSAGNWNIGLYDLYTSTGRLLTTNAADQVDPAIDGDRVVFADRRNGNWDIYSCNVQTGKTKRLTTSAAAQTNPSIHEGRIVYQDRRHGDWDIYLYDLSTGKERRLTNDPHNQTAPDIDKGRTVIYQDDRNGAADLYLCDLKSGQNRRVTDDPAAQVEPSLSETSVAWTDQWADGGDIYRAEIEYPSLSFGWDADDPHTPPAYDSTLRFRGTLRVGYGDVGALSVLVSGQGSTRKVDVVPNSEDFGTFHVTLRHVRRKVTLRASFPGTARYLAATPDSTSVKPKALLTRPSFTKVPAEEPFLIGAADFAATGYLRPHHRAGSRAVTLQVWVYRTVVKPGETPHWELDKTVTPTIKDHEGYSSYQVKVHLAGWGPTRWKVRALHADADHAKTVSSFSAVRAL